VKVARIPFDGREKVHGYTAYGWSSASATDRVMVYITRMRTYLCTFKKNLAREDGQNPL
jgi:hypothetical protein